MHARLQHHHLSLSLLSYCALRHGTGVALTIRLSPNSSKPSKSQQQRSKEIHGAWARAEAGPEQVPLVLGFDVCTLGTTTQETTSMVQASAGRGTLKYFLRAPQTSTTPNSQRTLLLPKPRCRTMV